MHILSNNADATSLKKRDDTVISWYAMTASSKMSYTLSLLRQQHIYGWAPFYKSAAADNSLMPLILFRATERQVYGLFCDNLFPGFIYRKPGAGPWEPCRIGNMEVRRFKTIRDLDTGQYRYFADAKKVIEKGKPVKVIDGMFRGMEGYLCRIKGNTSLYVNIPGICVVSVAYIPKSCLEGYAEMKFKQEKESSLQVEREETILSLSDRFNRLPFAGYSPEEYLAKYPLLQSERQSFALSLAELSEQCRQQGIKTSELYLNFDMEQWTEALASS